MCKRKGRCIIIKNILLTGSGGFIGNNLKKQLSQRYNLYNPRSFELDLRDKRAVEDFFINHKVDFIIHCSSVGGTRGVSDKDTTVKDNLEMFQNLLSAKKDGVRVILFGSGAMYDRSRNLHKVKESEIGEFVPDELYGRAKTIIAEKIKERADVLCLNIFACYGYGEKETRFPSFAIEKALKNQDIVINKNAVFDYLWIEDLVSVVEYFIENEPKNNILNITPNNSCTLEEIANCIKKISGGSFKIVVQNDILSNEYTGSNELLLKEIPNFRFTSLEDGLKKLYEYKKSQCMTLLGEPA